MDRGTKRLLLIEYKQNRSFPVDFNISLQNYLKIMHMDIHSYFVISLQRLMNRKSRTFTENGLLLC